MPDAGEDVVQLLVLVAGIAHTVGGHQGQVEPSRDIDERLVAVLLVAQSMSLELDVNASLEQMGQVEELSPGGVCTAHLQNMGQELSVSAGEAVEPRAVFLEVLPIDPSVTLGSPSSRTGQQSTQIAVANAVADEQGETDLRFRVLGARSILM